MSGYQGKKNIYVCEKCQGHVVTVDVDAGVTPFMLGCKATDGCKGMMKSSMYRVYDQTMKAAFEWHLQSSTVGMSEAMNHHTEMGGLSLREADNG